MLFKLLTLPFRGPIDAVTWIGEKLQDAALAQIYDTEAIRKELALTEAKLERGEMTEEEFEAIEAVLIERLKEASRRLQKAGPG
jgi:Gas vesicle protein G